MRAVTETKRNRARPQRSTDRGEPTAPVLNIQRMSTEDGPGLRTTVFLKGCSLACRWCHNPESMEPKPQVVWHDWKCIGSHLCNAICPEDALRRDGTVVRIDEQRCTVCGDCVARCPSTALETLGTQRSVGEVVAELLKDRNYYERHGGGITVSGGEPALRPRFVGRLIEQCRDLGVHTAVDTCGACSPEALDRVTEAADLVLYDLKEIDHAKHSSFTGRSNKRVLSNLDRLAVRMRQNLGPRELWIRTPMIPGATATEKNLTGIGRFLAERCEGVVTRWELCAFNNLARDKYRRMERIWDYEATELLSRDELDRLASIAAVSGVDPSMVVATGSTRIED